MRVLRVAFALSAICAASSAPAATVIVFVNPMTLADGEERIVASRIVEVLRTGG